MIDHLSGCTSFTVNRTISLTSHAVNKLLMQLSTTQCTLHCIVHYVIATRLALRRDMLHIIHMHVHIHIYIYMYIHISTLSAPTRHTRRRVVTSPHTSRSSIVSYAAVAVTASTTAVSYVGKRNVSECARASGCVSRMSTFDERR